MSSSPNRPKVVCLTGGIGSGKSTVAKMFAQRGIGIYNADESAKKLMQEDPLLKTALITLLGKNTYDPQGRLNRPWIAQRLFNDSELLNQWNALVHPRVAMDFNHWLSTQNGLYVIKEAAILFETQGHKKCDLSLLIIAPEQERINRVMQRDLFTLAQVQERIKHQWSDEKKIALADFVIENLDLKITAQEVDRLHYILTKS